MDAAMLERAVQATGKVVAGTSKEQMDDATPCTEWSVRDLLNHMIASYEAVAVGGGGEPSGTGATDFTAGDHVAAYEAASARAIDALAAPGALEKTFKMPWGDTPGQVLLGLMIADTAVHGWDLAKATGQETPVEPDVAEAVFGSTTGMLEPQGKPPRGGSFAAPVDVPGDAPVHDRMLAYLGRRP